MRLYRRLGRLALAAAFAIFASEGADAQVRMVEVNEVSDEVTIHNFGSGPDVDVSGYWMCLAPGSYQQVSSLTIVGGGDLSLSPGEEVTFVYTPVPPAGGIGLYTTTGFTNPANMADYAQYDGVVGVREPVAVAAGIWVAGTFATGADGPFFYTGNGTTQNGAAFWTNSPPSATPALGAWGLLGLAGLLTVAASGVLRRRTAG
jgi:hypothetical protein